MHKAEYAKYLTSVEWQARRKAALLRAAYRCQLCNTNSTTLNVHHRTYERVGREHPADLTVLCRPCHERFHGILPELEAAPVKKREKPVKVARPAKKPAKPRAPRPPRARATAPKKTPPIKTSRVAPALRGRAAIGLAPVLAAMPNGHRFSVDDVHSTGTRKKAIRAALESYANGGYVEAGTYRDEWVKLRSPRYISAWAAHIL